MDEIRNGVSATRLPGAAWRKSSFSGAVGNCVEIAHLPGGQAALRNSRNPRGPVLVHALGELAAFVDTARNW